MVKFDTVTIRQSIGQTTDDDISFRQLFNHIHKMELGKAFPISEVLHFLPGRSFLFILLSGILTWPGFQFSYFFTKSYLNSEVLLSSLSENRKNQKKIWHVNFMNSKHSSVLLSSLSEKRKTKGTFGRLVF